MPHNLSKAKIIIQARAGSSRLPGKMLMPFYNGLTILQIIVLNLKDYFEKEQIVVATTDNAKDNEIALAAKELGVNVFRGNEDDVLDRFIKAAEYYNAETIIRVCGDNPFLQAGQVKFLLENFLSENPLPDYMSFAFPDGTPVIKSHIGLFAEATTVKALCRVAESTSNAFYHEHVTNYLYSEAGQFNTVFLQLPDDLKDRKDIRMTIDTIEDFNLMKQLFSEIGRQHGYHIPVSAIISYIYKNQNVLSIMANEIKRNSK